MRVEGERLRALPSHIFELVDFDREGSADGMIHYDQRTVPVKIVFGQDFPYVRPTVHTEDATVRGYRHVNQAGEVCTLRYEPDEWNPATMTAADLVRRAWKLVANEGHIEPSEDDSAPIAIDVNVEPGTELLAPEDASPGPAEYGWAALSPARLGAHALVLDSLSDSEGRLVWSPGSNDWFGRLIVEGQQASIPWVATPATPPWSLGSLDDLLAILPEGALRSNVAEPLRGSGIRKRESANQFVLLTHEDETGRRWFLVEVQLTRGRNGRIRGSASYRPSYSVGPGAYFGRIEGLVSREQLQSSRVAIIGQGAIGSTISYFLNQCGVGTIYGFDGDSVEPGNPVRGYLPFSHVGASKARSLQESLHRHLPFTKYEAIPFATSTPEGRAKLEELLNEGLDLVVVAVGHHNTSRAIDALLAERGVRRLYAWTTRGAAAAVVLALPHAEGINTYEEYDALVRAGAVDRLPEIGEEEIPNVPERGCSTPVLPATPLDIASTALRAAGTALSMLEGDAVPQYQVWRRDTGYWQEGSDWTRYPARAGARPVEAPLERIELSYDARLEMEAEIRNSPRHETGGVLVGTRQAHVLRLDYAGGPGSRAVRTRSRLVIDTGYAQGSIDALRQLTNDTLRYQGEWHSHPSGRLTPSDDDLDSLLMMTGSASANISEPVILIASLDEGGELELKVFSAPEGQVRELPVTILELRTASESHVP